LRKKTISKLLLSLSRNLVAFFLDHPRYRSCDKWT